MVAVAALVQLQSDGHWVCGLQLDVHVLVPFAAEPEGVFLVVALGHVGGLCCALGVGVPGWHGLGSRVPPGWLRVGVDLFSVPVCLPGLDGGDAAGVCAALVGVRVRA